MLKISIRYILIFFLFLLCFCTVIRRTAGVSPQQEGSNNFQLGSGSIINPPKSIPRTSITKTDGLLENILKQYPQYFNDILKNRDALRIQIIYTQIDRQINNTPVFKNYYFNFRPDNYFYPASTVKLPVALLALQRLKELKLPGLNRNSTMITENAYSGQTPVFNDPTTPDGRPTIAQYVRKIFLVSDNDAFNRLYEFLGQQYINEELHRKGYEDVQILHRLDVYLNEDENRHTNPVRFLDSSGKFLYEQPMQESRLVPSQRNNFLGKGFMRNDTLIEQPFNFSRKNLIGLEDLHNILKSLLFPNAVPEKQRFNLTADDYRFVWKYMSQYPSETLYPVYDTVNYWDAYCKFLYWGSEKGQLPKKFRIFNKVGDAYGFLIDVAYVADFEKNIEFMLAATIYCNSDEVFNDDKYDYDSVGLPFMKNLGRVIYDYERNRKRTYSPDLSAFKFNYEK